MPTADELIGNLNKMLNDKEVLISHHAQMIKLAQRAKSLDEFRLLLMLAFNEELDGNNDAYVAIMYNNHELSKELRLTDSKYMKVVCDEAAKMIGA